MLVWTSMVGLGQSQRTWGCLH